MKLDLIFNGKSDDDSRVFASFKGMPENPSVRITAEHFAAVFGTKVEKGDGFSVETSLKDAAFYNKCFVVMDKGNPLRDEKRHVIRFNTEDAALAASSELDESEVLETYTYVDFGEDLELVEGVRKGEASGAAKFDPKAAKNILGV